MACEIHGVCRADQELRERHLLVLCLLGDVLLV